MTEIDESPTTEQSAQVTRRVMLRTATVGGVALPFLAACGGGDAAGDNNGDSGGGAGTLAKADVPVGGGKILKDQEVVVTQPTKGDFKAFTAICTHQGCTVTSIEDGDIVCGCHGSRFSIEDGSNTEGPNGSAAGSVADLQSKKVSVEGDQISVS
jgi:nitrite reductase/ring-hydroxylating ferredoxin subunit